MLASSSFFWLQQDDAQITGVRDQLKLREDLISLMKQISDKPKKAMADVLRKCLRSWANIGEGTRKSGKESAGSMKIMRDLSVSDSLLFLACILVQTPNMVHSMFCCCLGCLLEMQARAIFEASSVYKAKSSKQHAASYPFAVQIELLYHATLSTCLSVNVISSHRSRTCLVSCCLRFITSLVLGSASVADLPHSCGIFALFSEGWCPVRQFTSMVVG